MLSNFLNYGFGDLMAFVATVFLRVLFEVSKLYYWRQSKTLLIWCIFSVVGLYLITSGFAVLILKVLASGGVGYLYYTRILDHRDKNTFIGLLCLALVYVIWGHLLF